MLGSKEAVYPYLKKGVKPSDLVVSVDGNKLTSGKDYTLSYSNNTKTALFDSTNGAGKSTAPTVNIKFKGNYKGNIKRTFSIAGVDIGSLSMTVDDVPYQDKAGIYKSSPVIVDAEGTKLAAGTDYEKNPVYTYTAYTKVQRRSFGKTMTYYKKAGAAVDSADIIPAGTVLKVTVTGKGNYASLDDSGSPGTICDTFRIAERSVKDITFTVDDFEYTGSAIRPLRVKDGLSAKGIHAHYTQTDSDGNAVTVDACADNSFVIVSYSSNINRGTGRITVRGAGRFAGTRTITFKILKRNAGKAN